MMVAKSRAITHYLVPTVGGNPAGLGVSLATVEAMVDSSTTGSPRTDLDAVDKFLANPTNQYDFHAALRESAQSPGDAGTAEFRVERTRVKRTVGGTVLTGTSGSRTVTGVGGSFNPSLSMFPEIELFTPLTKSEMKSKGQELYHRALPNKDQAQLGTMLGEIVTNPVRAAAIPTQAIASRVSRYAREVQSLPNRFNNGRETPMARRLKQVAGLSLDDQRAAADDYLAYIFGARPTVSDLDALAESISKSRNVAETVIRSSDRRLRRRRSMHQQVADASSTITESVRVGLGTGFNPPLIVVDGTSHYFSHATSDCWWSGSFQYHASDTKDWVAKSSDFFKSIDRITGIGLDVRTAWDLIPFSFLADWFANTGTFLENRQVLADYNIACEYGYVMNHVTHTRTGIVHGPLQVESGNPATVAYYGKGDVSFVFERLEETKGRLQCGSYGYSTSFDQLNAYQMGALAALGLSASFGVPPTRRA